MSTLYGPNTSVRNLTNSTSLLTDRALQVEVITLAFLCPTLMGSLPFVGPGYDIALEDIKVLYPKLNFSQNIVGGKKMICSVTEWMDVYEMVLAEFYFKSFSNKAANVGLTAFVMSGADDVFGVARFATELDRLLISSVALKGKGPWPSWITTSTNSMTTYSKVFENMVRMFNWTNFAMTYDLKPNTNPFYKTSADFIHDHLTSGQKRNRAFVLPYNTGYFQPPDYLNLMRNMSGHSRVTFFFGNTQPLQALLTAAATLNMTDGDYVFIALIPFRGPVFAGTYMWDGTSGEAVKNAFKCLIMVEQLRPSDDENSRLNLQWKQRSRTKYNFTYGPNETLRAGYIDTVCYSPIKVTPYPSTSYGAMMVLAEAVEEIRLNGNDQTLQSGRELAKMFRNRTFHLRTGKLKFNEYGENVPYMALTQTDVSSQEIKVIMELDAETDRLIAKRPFEWQNIWPVPDEPRCGFRGDAPICRYSDSDPGLQYGASIGTTFAVIIIALIGFFVARNTESETQWWCIHPDDFVSIDLFMKQMTKLRKGLF